MKVALLSRSAHPLHPPGGMERAVYSLAKHLRAQGVDVTLFTRPGKNPEAFPGRVVTIKYQRFHVGPHGRVLDRTFNYPTFSVLMGREVAARVRAGDIDIVDAQGLTALGYGRERLKDPSLKAPLVMNPQGMEEHHVRGFKALALSRLKQLSKEAAQLADCVIATDEATKDDVPRLLEVDPGRVRVIPNGVDLEELRALTPEDALPFTFEVLPWMSMRSPLFISVGRLETYKGFADSLEAFKRAAAFLPADWGWLVVGEGPSRLSLQAAAFGLKDHIQFTGRVSEQSLHALYAGSDVFLHPTRFEGSSLVTLEAMAHGLPVIATRAGGIPDKVKDGVNGYLVNPGDVEALSAAIVKMANAPEDRARMRKETLQLLDPFLWPHIAKRVIAQYERLLHERKKR
ncbi:MAG TPA: glycosyltransferase family 4 protein [Vicinamibacteria bacterium]|nr:glycosyltransferase family 4 protein [Vicinamibacteria bacterium]HRB13034.1 glycosyltransferase family 4 protein [Vicinamibacteria bacterium]